MMSRTLLFTRMLFVCIILVGFRSNNNPLSESGGQKLYEQHCMRCHGNDGTKGSFGAKDLQQSILADAAIMRQIERGKGFMPPFRRKLNANEIEEVMRYIKSLRIKE